MVDAVGLSALKSFREGSSVLEELGGLKVGGVGAGFNCGKSDIEFRAAASVANRYSIADRPDLHADELFPIADAHNGHMELFVGASVRLYALNVVDGRVSVVSDEFSAGIEKILLGHRWW